MTKKKKGQDADGDDDREQSRTPIRSELDKLEGITLLLFTYILYIFFKIPKISLELLFSLPAEKEQTPLQEALNQLIRQLQRCSTDHFLIFTEDLSVCLFVYELSHMHRSPHSVDYLKALPYSAVTLLYACSCE